jgi:hypothetical protein
MSHSDASPVPIPDDAARTGSAWTPGRVATLAIGTLFALLALTLLGAAGTALWADRTQRDGGYVTSDPHAFSTSGSALATEETELGGAGVGWLYGPDLLGKVRIRVTPRTPGSRLFVGIARSADVDRYLAGVDRTVISEFFEDKVEPVDGGTAGSAPGTQDFWVASSSGAGPRTVVWEPSDGSWSVVVMNADARPALDVEADLGARFAALPWIALGVFVAGAIFAAGGGLLIVGAFRNSRSS